MNDKIKILMIVAKKNFRDEEFQIPFDAFISEGFDVDIASSTKGGCVGRFDTKVDAAFSLKSADVSDYSAIVVVGGEGSKEFDDSEDMINLLAEASKHDKVIGSICRAGVILAKAGILQGKEATVWNEEGSNAIILEELGAEYVDKDNVIDGKIVTANGPKAAQKFAEDIISLVSS